MTDLQKTFLKSYKRRLKQKIDDVVEDAENACSVIQEKTSMLREQACVLLETKDDKFLADYQKLQKDIDWFSDKLFILMKLISSTDEDDKNKSEDVASPSTSEVRCISPVVLSKSQSNIPNASTKTVKPSEEKDSGISLNSHHMSVAKFEETYPSQPSSANHDSSNSFLQKTSADEQVPSVELLSSNATLSVTSSEICLSLESYGSEEVREIRTKALLDDTCENGVVFSTEAAISSSLSDNIDIGVAAKQSICGLNISYDCSMPCFVTKFTSPSDFWIQFDSPAIESIAEILALYSPLVIDISLNNVKYCAVMFEQAEYRRAEILSVKQNEAEILFVDYGDMKTVSIEELKKLPNTLHNYPAQAIHCFLSGVVPCGNDWLPEALLEFVKLSCYDLQASVLHQCGDRFAVQLTYASQHLEEACDLSDSLCILGYALSIADKTLDVDNSPVKPTEEEETAARYINEQSEVSDKNQILSTSSNVDSSLSPDKSPEMPSSSLHKCSEDNKVAVFNFAGRLSQKNSEGFTIHAVIPPPQPLLLQDDLLIVMPAFIYSPTYFYVHYTMEKPLDLDELREQMTDFYNNLQGCSDLALDVKDLKEDMFLACPYEDGYWYRVQVNLISDNQNSKNLTEVVVLYVDYGNESSVLVGNLRPLTEKFAKYPSMAILCALANIVPEECDLNNKPATHLMKWNVRATDRFVEMTVNEKPLTAQISKFVPMFGNRILHEVFLWDRDSDGDRILNDVLVEEKLANYCDLDTLPQRLLPKSPKSSSQTDLKQLDTYDPMSADFHAVENSYGVNLSDPEVAATGYKATDESYVCKYFSSGRTCYRNACPYKHMNPICGGATQDQDGVYLYENSIQLPEPGTHCLLQVSSVMSPSHFYVVFPFSTHPVSELQRNPGLWTHHQKEFEQLAVAMNHYYNTAPFDENSTVALAYGTIVAAKAKHDGNWYRAQIMEVDDVTKPVQVFFIDFGIMEWVERRNIRQMLPQFLHCPFQAVEAWLANVDPMDCNGSKRWSSRARSWFERLVSGKTLLAYVHQKINSTLFLTLTTTSKTNRIIINNALIQEGLAQISSSSPILCPWECQLNAAQRNDGLFIQPG